MAAASLGGRGGECSRGPRQLLVKALYLAMGHQHFLYESTYLRNFTEYFFSSFFTFDAHGMGRNSFDYLMRRYTITF